MAVHRTPAIRHPPGGTPAAALLPVAQTGRNRPRSRPWRDRKV